MKFTLATLNGAAVDAINSAETGEPSNTDLDAQIADIDKIAELAGLNPVEYDRQRTAAAKELNVRTSTLDKAVAKQRPPATPDERADLIIFPAREKAAAPVDDIGGVLDAASDLILSHMAMDAHWGDVVALWCLHTYAVDCFPVSPRLAVESPTPECGKSTLLNIVKELVYRPLKTSNIQPAGIFRIAEHYAPTMLIDEGDAFLHDNEPLRGIFNSGHAKGDVVIRVEGDPLTPKPYKVFGACAFGLIGELPSTLQSRSIACKLKRATAAEVSGLKSFRTDKPPAICAEIAARFWRWAEDHQDELATADPDMSGMINRRRDNWRVLFAIADVVGGPWPEKIRDAALRVNGVPDALPQNIELLSDIRGIVAPGGSPNGTPSRHPTCLGRLSVSTAARGPTGRPASRCRPRRSRPSLGPSTSSRAAMERSAAMSWRP